MISQRALGAASVSFALAMTTLAAASAAEPTKKQCVAANESGQDLRQGGKLREARAALAVCMSPRCPRPVREDCAQRLADIEAALPTLVFVAKDGDGNDLRDVDVSMDGQALATSDGTAVAVDPGDHSFTFTKEGLPTSQSEVVVREGDKNRRVQIVLGTPKAAAATSGSPASSAFAQGPGLKPVTGLFGLSPNEERGVGLGVGVAGLIGLGVGSVFGFMAKATYDHAVQQCPAGNTRACTAPGAAGRQTAGDQAEVSTIAFIAGGALVAAGAVLYLATPSGSVTVGPTLADRGVGLGVGGRF